MTEKLDMERERSCVCVFPGVTFCPLPGGGFAEGAVAIQYCHTGHFQAGEQVLSAGDVWFGQERMRPLSDHCTGAVLLLDLRLGRQAVRNFAAESLGVELDMESLEGNLQRDQDRVLRGPNELSRVFSQLFLTELPYREGFFRLKAMELLLHLSAWEGERQRPGRPYLDRGQIKRVQEIQQYLMEHLDQRMTQKNIAKTFNLSVTSLKNTFQSVYGMPLDAYLRHQRIAAAKQLLLETALPVSEIAHRVGYESHSQFSAVFHDSEGMSPAQYRKRAADSLKFQK